MVLSENALFAIMYGHPMNGLDQASKVLRQIINDIDRQENDSSHERTGPHEGYVDGSARLPHLRGESPEVPEAGPAA